MEKISIEIKARCPDPVFVRKILRSRKTIFQGLDHQIDTYFHVPTGRFKLREGNIENALIFYKRENQRKSKKCESVLFPCPRDPLLKKILKTMLGILTVVDKRREIYFLENVKFHIDRVQRLGQFVEIEVFGPGKQASKLRRQCEFYQRFLRIRKKDLVATSYSDQILKKARINAQHSK